MREAFDLRKGLEALAGEALGHEPEEVCDLGSVGDLVVARRENCSIVSTPKVPANSSPRFLTGVGQGSGPPGSPGRAVMTAPETTRNR